jgi:hypothetical protein
MEVHNTSCNIGRLMKRYSIILMVLLVLTLSASLASATIDIPSHIYRIDQLQQAKEEAQADDKQIVFLYSDEDTKCSLASGASIRIMQRFKRSAVIVYFCKDGWAKVPRIVREAIKSREAGKFSSPKLLWSIPISRKLSLLFPMKGRGIERTSLSL